MSVWPSCVVCVCGEHSLVSENEHNAYKFPKEFGSDLNFSKNTPTMPTHLCDENLKTKKIRLAHCLLFIVFFFFWGG